MCLFLMAPFQNCGTGFRSAGILQSSTSSTSDLEEIQTKSVTLLSNNCKACHGDQGLGGISQISDVNRLLDSRLVIPGQPENSPILIAIEANRMPPNQPLADADKRVIKNWILALGGLGPDAQPLDLKFTMTISTDPLPFQTRLAKISRLPSSVTSTAIDTMRSNRVLLGDYDYARGVVPKYSWEASDIKNWLESSLPICASTETKNKFPWPTGMPNFLMATVGRSATATETQILNQIDALVGVSAAEKFEIFCLTTVASMEYVAK